MIKQLLTGIVYFGDPLPSLLHYSYPFCCSTFKKPIVGIAHHVSFMRPYGLFDIGLVSLANSLALFPYMDSIADKMDFIGMNYYGQVFIHPSKKKYRY